MLTRLPKTKTPVQNIQDPNKGIYTQTIVPRMTRIIKINEMQD